jgi:hypothetical protein
MGVISGETAVIPDFSAGPCVNGPQIVQSKIEHYVLYDCKGHFSQAVGPPPWNPTGRVKVGGFRFPGVPFAVFPAMELYCSDTELVNGDFEDSTWGIMLANSTVTLSGCGGSTNTLGGCYAHSGSHIWIPPAANGGVTPTVTGNSGTVELSKDGSTEESTWLALVNVAATGSITAVPVASLVDGETFVIDDGINPAVTFEFDNNGSVVETATLRQVDISAITTDAEVATAIYNAITNAPTLNITAVAPATNTVGLTNDVVGVVGNVAITETVLDGGFTVAGMSGGQDDTPVSDPEVTAKEWKPFFWF